MNIGVTIQFPGIHINILIQMNINGVPYENPSLGAI